MINIRTRFGYASAVQIAARLIELDLTGVTVGIIGRYSVSTFISFYTNILVGNSIICIDSDRKSGYRNLDFVKAQVVFVDPAQMKEDFDFSRFPSLKVLAVVGRRCRKTLLPEGSSIEQFNFLVDEQSNYSDRDINIYIQGLTLEYTVVYSKD